MIGIIIQARMGSTRFPGKVLKPLAGKPLISYIIDRLKRLKNQVHIILATSSSPQDDIIEQYCHKYAIDCFRGDEENVLERYYYCAKLNHFSQIVRLTADNPFTDIEELDNLIELHLHTLADYSYSFDSLPKGVGAEVFTYNSIEKSYLHATQAHHLEHVNEYILENPDDFKINVLKVKADKFKPELSLTIDTPEEYQKIVQLLSQHQHEFITTEKVIQICSQLA